MDANDIDHLIENVDEMSLGQPFSINRYVKFLMTDRKTEKYVKFAKVMLIFQAPLCSELKRIISALSVKFQNCSRILTDESFEKETICSHHAFKTEDFHQYFKKETKRACEEGNNLIVVHQSVAYLAQMKYFCSLAKKSQYILHIVPPILSTQEKTMLGRNVFSQAKCLIKEGVEREHVKMKNYFEHYFCGWFLHDADSDALRCEASMYVQDCYENIPEFAKLYSNVCTVESFRSYFNLEDRKQDLAYCIVNIFRNPKSVANYFDLDCVQEFYGKMAKLHITGFIISPFIIAARVKLSHKQKELWKMANDIDENSPLDLLYPSEIRKKVDDLETSFQGIKVSIVSKCNPSLVSKGDPLYKPTEMIPLNSRGRSCHIVLGKAPNASARNIDCDVPFAVFRERYILGQNHGEVGTIDIGSAIVRRIGKYWYIYLKKLLVIDGFFSTFSLPKEYDIRI